MNRSHPFLRSAGLAVLAPALLLGAQGAWAACTVTPGYVEMTVNMAMGRVLIPNDAPVGTMFKSQFFPLPLSGTTSTQVMTCKSGGNVKGEMLQGTRVPGYDHVFSTAVPGVGIRLSRYFGPTEVTYYPHDRLFPATTSSAAFEPGSRFQVELFKTGIFTGSGPLAQGVYTRYYSPADNKSVLTTTLLGDGITIITPSCSVDLGSRNIPVAFGKVPASAFQGKGSTAAERHFNIRLNCKAGTGVRNTVYLRMGSPQVPWSRQDGVLQIKSGTAGTVATGVGIQVLDQRGQPVKFSGDDGDDILVGQSKDGAYVIPFIGRYYQTANKITPGRADGTATFDIEYK
ncbi:Fimbria adhesin protein precursor [compost metagenome]